MLGTAVKVAMPRVFVHVLHLGLCFAACASVSQGQMLPPAAAEPPTPTTASLASAGRADGGIAASGVSDASAGVVGDGRAPMRAAGPEGNDRGADADLDMARALFDRGDQPAARVALEGFVAHHRQHPNRATAEILLARLALGRGEPAAAKNLLDPLVAATPESGDPGSISTSARYYLGVTEVRLGNLARARTLLAPFAPRSGTADPAPGDDAAIELRGALAEATAASDPIAALELWEGYARVAREHEKAWARTRALEVSARVSAEAAWRAYGAAPPSGLTRAVLGAKAANYLRGRGDAAGAAFIESEANAARHALGFDTAAARVGPGDPTRIGLSIPLSGKFQVVGEAVLRAAMLAGGAPGSAATASQLVLRDTATDPERAARGIAELTRTEAVIGIVGAPSAKAGGAAIAQAALDGIALLALEDAPPGALSTAFQVVHAPEARAGALARQALKLGVRRFAILGPDSTAGKRLRDAFRKAVADGGGTIVAESSYVAGATSFAGALAPLKKAAFQAIFIPESAERLPLIAPALAVADMWPQPWAKVRAASNAGGKNRPRDQPRPVLLLSTANELSHKLTETAGRYVQGALLCPGFFADDQEPHARAFVEAYRAAYGQEPHATEAYAFDAVSTFRALTQRGAQTRADVIKALGAGGGAPIWQGLTGNITFGPDHGRADGPLVYLVDGDDIHLVRAEMSARVE